MLQALKLIEFVITNVIVMFRCLNSEGVAGLS
jgi:hypothetical protein